MVVDRLGSGRTTRRHHDRRPVASRGRRTGAVGLCGNRRPWGPVGLGRRRAADRRRWSLRQRGAVGPRWTWPRRLPASIRFWRHWPGVRATPLPGGATDGWAGARAGRLRFEPLVAGRPASVGAGAARRTRSLRRRPDFALTGLDSRGPLGSGLEIVLVEWQRALVLEGPRDRGIRAGRRLVAVARGGTGGPRPAGRGGVKV